MTGVVGQGVKKFRQTDQVVEIKLFIKRMHLIHTGGNDRRRQAITTEDIGIAATPGNDILQGFAGCCRCLLYPFDDRGVVGKSQCRIITNDIKGD